MTREPGQQSSNIAMKQTHKHTLNTHCLIYQRHRLLSLLYFPPCFLPSFIPLPSPLSAHYSFSSCLRSFLSPFCFSKFLLSFLNAFFLLFFFSLVCLLVYFFLARPSVSSSISFVTKDIQFAIKNTKIRPSFLPFVSSFAHSHFRRSSFLLIFLSPS